MAKTLLFASQWGIRWEVIRGDDIDPFFGSLKNPSASLPVLKEDSEDFLCFTVVLIEHI